MGCRYRAPLKYTCLLKEKYMSNNTLTLGRIDFGPLTRFTVGLDEMFNDLQRINTGNQGEPNYPPYNIIKYNDDSYAIELAVAGFDLSEIDINVENNHLIITGDRIAKPSIESNYVHRGISSRNFTKTFTLGNYLEVNGATLKNGMLTISLIRIVPDNLKAKKISITSTE